MATWPGLELVIDIIAKRLCIDTHGAFTFDCIIGLELSFTSHQNSARCLVAVVLPKRRLVHE